MSYRGGDDEGSDGSEGEEEEEFDTKEDKIIFLMDIREPMFQKNEKGEVIIINCLTVALSILKSKIISDDKSSIGIIFYGSNEVNGSNPGVYTLIPLEAPRAKSIRLLQSYLDDENKLKEDIGSSKQCPLKQALWECLTQYDNGSNSTLKIAREYKRLWIFTNDDSPNESDLPLQSQTLNVGQDCVDKNIEISLWYINNSNKKPFNIDKFYKKLLDKKSTVNANQHEDDEDDDVLETRVRNGGNTGFDKILTNIKRKSFRKRSLCSLPLSFGLSSLQNNEYEHMAVKLYRDIMICKIPTPVVLNSRTNDIAGKATRLIDGETGESLGESMLTTYVNIGPDGPNDIPKLNFTKEDVIEAKSLLSPLTPGISILFFIPESEVSRCDNIDSPLFLFPDEKSVKGSNALFTSLLTTLSEKKLVGVVKFVRNSASMQRMALLIPQLEQLDEDDAQDKPPGFNLVLLPYLEEIRAASTVVNPDIFDNTSDSSVQVASEYIKGNMYPENFKYERDISNPILQKFYSILEAMALLSEEIEWDIDKDDNMRPRKTVLNQEIEKAKLDNKMKISDINQLENYYNNLITTQQEVANNFADEFELDKIPDIPEKKPRAATKEKVTKKRKSDHADLDNDEVNLSWKTLSDNDLQSKTLTELKEICKQNKLKVSGKKDELINRIIEIQDL